MECAFQAWSIQGVYVEPVKATEFESILEKEPW